VFFTVFSATILAAYDFLKLLLYYQRVKQDFPFFWDLTLHHWLIGAQHFKITTSSPSSSSSSSYIFHGVGPLG